MRMTGVPAIKAVHGGVGRVRVVWALAPGAARESAPPAAIAAARRPGSDGRQAGRRVSMNVAPPRRTTVADAARICLIRVSSSFDFASSTASRAAPPSEAAS